MLTLLTHSPVQTVLLALAVTPLMHILLTTTLERRRLQWSHEYPAVLVGDPVLALSLGFGVAANHGQTATSFVTATGVVIAAVATSCAWGYLQSRSELRRGRFTPSQITSPSKLWHQYVVYPALTYCSLVVYVDAFAHARWSTTADRLLIGAMLASWLVWLVLAIEANLHPREGHGEFDWRRLSAAHRAS